MSIENEITEDIRTAPPPTQEGKILECGHTAGIGKLFASKPDISCFGFSLQGASHRKREPQVPCQDYNDFRFAEDAGVLLAAIADGVGSCEFSHWGAYVAVTAALDSLEEAIKELSEGKRMKLSDFQDELNAALKAAFQNAMDAVEAFAKAQGCASAKLHSTLTLLAYDGEVACCEHAGDDGVVAQFEDGSVMLMTSRIKGEEANSVFPLQSGSRAWRRSWAGMKERGRVVALLMATDGVLDRYMPEKPNLPEELAARWEACLNGINYSFMVSAVYDKDGKPRNAETSMQVYLDYVKKNDFQKRVSDDVTIVSVVNGSLLSKATVPHFDGTAYNRLWEDIQKWQEEQIYLDQHEMNTDARIEPIKPTEGNSDPDRQTVDAAASEAEEPAMPEGEKKQETQPQRKDRQDPPPVQGKKRAKEIDRDINRYFLILALLLALVSAAFGLLAGKLLFGQSKETTSRQDTAQAEAAAVPSPKSELTEAPPASIDIDDSASASAEAPAVEQAPAMAAASDTVSPRESGAPEVGPEDEQKR